MRRAAAWTALFLVVYQFPTDARAQHLLRTPLGRHELDRVNRSIAGTVVDYSANHGVDRRLYSEALHEKRAMYVYLPPGYDPCKQYPLIMWLHGFAQDERSFLSEVVRRLDRAVVDGRLPAAIVVAPDGSLEAGGCIINAGSFFLNSPAGRFEDYLMQDVYNFVIATYPIRPEAKAHVMAGVSMGGGAAFNKVIKYPEVFHTAAGLFPPVNLRWENCRGRYMANFDPDCWGWREDFDRPLAPVGRFYGVLTVRTRQVINPLFGRRNPDATAEIARENPIEMLEAYDVRAGSRKFFIGYGGRDEFNIDAQVESFLYVARERGVPVTVEYDPKGHHNLATAVRLLPGLFAFIKEQLAPYAPAVECGAP